MSTFSIGGLVTGIDTQSLISKLMEVERSPEKLMQAKQSRFKNQIDVYTQIETALKSLQSKATAMNSGTSFRALQSTVADATVLGVTASSSATAGTHTIEVTTLAKNQRQVSVGYADNTEFSTGTFTVDDGNGTVTTVNLAEGGNTLVGIAAALNASGANVTASLINDGSGTPNRLVVNGKDSKNYTLDFSGLVHPPVSGAPALAPTLLGVGDPTYQAGQEATFKVDGVSITKSTNTVTDVLSGVTLNLLKENSSTTFTVTNDTAAMTGKINDLVSAYNGAVNLINAQSTYNADTKKAGVLSGDSTLRTLQNKLQNLLTASVTGAAGPYKSLAELGITSDKKNGTLSVDSTKLSDALANNFDAVVNLFTQNTDTRANLSIDNYGIAQQFNLTIEPLVHSWVGSSASNNGLIESRIHGLKSSIGDIDDQISHMEDRIAKMQDALQKKYTALESRISTLQSQGNQLLSALSAYSSYTSNR